MKHHWHNQIWLNLFITIYLWTKFVLAQKCAINVIFFQPVCSIKGMLHMVLYIFVKLKEKILLHHMHISTVNISLVIDVRGQTVWSNQIKYKHWKANIKEKNKSTDRCSYPFFLTNFKNFKFKFQPWYL